MKDKKICSLEYSLSTELKCKENCSPESQTKELALSCDMNIHLCNRKKLIR